MSNSPSAETSKSSSHQSIASVLLMVAVSTFFGSSPVYADDGSKESPRPCTPLQAGTTAIGVVLPADFMSWICFQEVLKESLESGSQADRDLIAKIESWRQVHDHLPFKEMWRLYELRKAENKPKEAESCLNALYCMYKEYPVEYAFMVMRILLELPKPKEPKTIEEMKRFHAQYEDTILQSVWGRMYKFTGYCGVKIIDGKVDFTIKYSPAYKLDIIREGDEIVSVDGVLLERMDNDLVKYLLKGTPGTDAVFKVKRNAEVVVLKVPRVEMTAKIPPKLTARQYFELGVQLRDFGLPDAAREALVKARNMDPSGEAGQLAAKVIRARLPRFNPVGEPNDMLNIALMHRYGHKEEESEHLFKEIIEKYPEFEWTYKHLTGLYIERKQYKEAKEVATKLLEVNPDYARGWELLGFAKQGLGDIKGGVECFRRCHELDPDDDLAASYREIAAQAAKSKGEGSAEKEERPSSESKALTK